MKASVRVELFSLLTHMKDFQRTMGHARKEEPNNLDYVLLESTIGYWISELEKITV